MINRERFYNLWYNTPKKLKMGNNINFSEHYSSYWDEVKDKIDEEGWVYVKEVSYLLDFYFELNTGLSIDYQKSFSFLSGDNPNWTTRGDRWRPKSISLLIKKEPNI